MFYQEVVEEDDMGDIKFLSEKAFKTQLVTANGTRTTNGVITSITAASGKDLYIGEITVGLIKSGTPILSDVSFNANLVVDGTIEETISVAGDEVGGGYELTGKFTFKGFVTTTKTISVDVVLETRLGTFSGEGTATATMTCFEVSTGADPTL